MPNTRMTRDKLKNHLHYMKLTYLLVVILTVVVGNLIYTVTTYQPPNARRVTVEMVGAYGESGTEEAIAAENALLSVGQDYERTRDAAAGVDVDAADYEVPLQKVEICSLQYDETASESDTYYTYQKYIVTMAAQEGDIWFISRNQMMDLIEQGALMPLDEYLASGLLDAGDRNLDRVTFDEKDVDGNMTGNRYVFALQADAMKGMRDTFAYNPDGKYMVIMAYSENPDTAAVVMNEMIRLYTPEGSGYSENEGEGIDPFAVTDTPTKEP